MQFDRICRVCLVECDNMKSIFEESLFEKVRDLAGIQLDSNDALPKLLCNICVSEIHHWHTFKLKLLQSNATLCRLQKEQEGSFIKVKKEFSFDSNNVEVERQNSTNQSFHHNINEGTNISHIKKETFLELERCNLDTAPIKKEPLELDHNSQSTCLYQDTTSLKNEDTIIRQAAELLQYDEINETPKSYACQICSKQFETVSTLHRHQKFHAEIKPYSCEICQKSFTLLGNLRQHSKVHAKEKRNLHKGKRLKPFSCEYCARKYATAKQLQHHMRVHKQCVCEFCNKRFQHAESLRMHKKIHTGEEPFICHFCGHSCHQKRALENHIRSVHENFYICSFCSKGFPTNKSLRNHLRLHTGEKGCLKHLCNICDEWFVSPGQLKSHMGKHKPYKCDLCKKMFRNKKAKAAHRKTHLAANDGY